MNLVFIYGPPGVGKLAVAGELAKPTGFKLFDNHTRFDFARRLFDFGSERFWNLEARINRVVLEEALDGQVSVISTFLAPTPAVMAFLEPHLAALASKDGQPCFVRLSCERSAHERRLRAPRRAEAGKLTSVDALRSFLARGDDKLSLNGYAVLRIDNTTLPPDKVAQHIASHYHLPTQQPLTES
jgi:hypothetical protein